MLFVLFLIYFCIECSCLICFYQDILLWIGFSLWHCMYGWTFWYKSECCFKSIFFILSVMNCSTANVRVMKMILLYFQFTKEKKGNCFAETFHTVWNHLVLVCPVCTLKCTDLLWWQFIHGNWSHEEVGNININC